MKHFTRFLTGIDVSAINAELAAQPQLWDAYRERKDTDGTPHGQMSDIWVRFRPREELTSKEAYGEPHFPVWYPAADLCPSLKQLILRISGAVGSVHLGGVLITRIPPGGEILPHDDRGFWHAEYHNCKVYVPLQANPDCVNVCEDETVTMGVGEAWTFDNLKTHSVHNRGTEDRITLIIAMRSE